MEKSKIRYRSAWPDILPKAPIVEIAGQSRLLIENHLGVLGYSLNEIRVSVGYGSICVTGRDLRLLQMSKEQLVICGRVDAVHLFGR